MRQHLNLLSYQKKALDFILERQSSGLFLDMGLGKTAVVLSALKTIMTDEPVMPKVLIIGPKRVIEQTWPDELNKWEEFRFMSYSIIAGTPAKRLEAAKSNQLIHLISRDNLQWLIAEGLFDYNLVVIDELSSFKNPQSKRFRGLKYKLPSIDRVIGMTGTPVPNGLIDLWSQIYLLDGGKRLGKNISSYRNQYFTMSPFTPFPSYELRPGAEQMITESISDLCLAMTQKDYLQLPDRIDNNHIIQFDEPLQYLYKSFKQDMVLELKKQEQQITAVNAGVLAGKLLQFCGGSIYNNEGLPQQIHQLKLDKLEDIVEQANGKTVLVYYSFVHEADRIKERFGKLVTDIKEPMAIDKWNKGKVPLLLAHPASAGHGLNLQHGGNIIAWYNLTYDLELYQQANKRLHRMGQGQPVYVNHILIKGGMDETILNQVLSKKGKLMDSVMASLS